MSVSGALFNALSGLTAAARGVEVVSTNIANAMTDGFGRRELELGARALAGRGTGVTVTGVKRVVAMVVLGALNIDMAVLLKQRVGARPFRVFTDPLQARGWLMTFRYLPAKPAAAKPTGQGVKIVR